MPTRVHPPNESPPIPTVPLPPGGPLILILGLSSIAIGVYGLMGGATDWITGPGLPSNQDEILVALIGMAAGILSSVFAYTEQRPMGFAGPIGIVLNLIRIGFVLT